MEERLHKILAHAGYGSRRACEVIIADGRVTVNGRAAHVGDKAALGADDIRVDGRRVKPERKVYYLLNKPEGYLCTNADPQGRRKARDLLTGVHERVYPVGRLDADSRGLLIVTNDGELAARLTHLRYEVAKAYEAEIDGQISPEHVRQLMSGVRLSEGRTAPCRVRVLRRGRTNSILEFALREGMNRQVRRMLAKLGYKVRRLTRTRIGPLRLYGLGPGRFRELTPQEVGALFQETEQGGRAGFRAARPGRSEAVGNEAEAALDKGAGPGAEREPQLRPDRELARRRKVHDFTG